MGACVQPRAGILAPTWGGVAQDRTFPSCHPAGEVTRAGMPRGYTTSSKSRALSEVASAFSVYGRRIWLARILSVLFKGSCWVTKLCNDLLHNFVLAVSQLPELSNTRLDNLIKSLLDLSFLSLSDNELPQQWNRKQVFSVTIPIDQTRLSQ